MKRNMVRPPKAYKNLDFLNSPRARIIRILSEFIEPQARFQEAKVRDTIVFFGSSRIKSRGVALAQLRDIQASHAKARKASKRMMESLANAQEQVKMSRYYEDTVELARLLTKWSKTLDTSNRFVVCSGGGPGIMEAANKGASLAKGKSIGLNISLPFEQFANPYISKGLNFEFHYFFMRKFWFAYLAKALVVFPGGFGTLDELMEILTLLQTNKIRKKVTVVIYGKEYWNKILNFQELLKCGVISKSDLGLFEIMDSPQEAFEHLKSSLLKNYPTNRY